jgi:dolichol kinase
MFPIGIAAAYVLTGGQVPGYPIAVLALALGDPAAAVAGRRFARRYATIWGTRRSLEGSAVACLVSIGVTAVVLVVAGGVDPPSLFATSLAVGVSVALAEATSPRGFDNVTISVVAATIVGIAGAPVQVIAVLAALAVITIVGIAWDRPVMIGPIRRSGRVP